MAAAIKRSISAVVRYSRVRTEEFTVVGVDRPPLRFSKIFCPRSKITSELSVRQVGVDRGKPELGRRYNDQRALAVEVWVSSNEKLPSSLSRECPKGRGDLSLVAGTFDMDFEAQCTRCFI